MKLFLKGLLQLVFCSARVTLPSHCYHFCTQKCSRKCLYYQMYETPRYTYTLDIDDNGQHYYHNGHLYLPRALNKILILYCWMQWIKLNWQLDMVLGCIWDIVTIFFEGIYSSILTVLQYNNPIMYLFGHGTLLKHISVKNQTS